MPEPRRPLVAANWKMHGTVADGVTLARGVADGLPGLGSTADVVVCPPYTLLDAVGRAIRGRLLLGAQNLHWEDKGAFTGEVSGPMLTELGCSHVIIGHSERRQSFGETDETVRRRLAAAGRHSLRPILCVGETWEEREAGRTEAVIGGQLRGALAGGAPPHLAVAYEPVWAIGTGRAAKGAEAQEVARFIRGVLGDLVGPEIAAATRLLYGGSVKADNTQEFSRQPDIDGALVGGASLDAGAFVAIVRQVVK